MPFPSPSFLLEPKCFAEIKVKYFISHSLPLHKIHVNKVIVPGCTHPGHFGISELQCPSEKVKKQHPNYNTKPKAQRKTIPLNSVTHESLHL